jgi:hypothetical protein
MKKQTFSKKLSLKKETIVTLSRNQQEAVKGGSWWDCDNSACACFSNTFTQYCIIACGTEYCG